MCAKHKCRCSKPISSPASAGEGGRATTASLTPDAHPVSDREQLMALKRDLHYARKELAAERARAFDAAADACGTWGNSYLGPAHGDREREAAMSCAARIRALAAEARGK